MGRDVVVVESCTWHSIQFGQLAAEM